MKLKKGKQVDLIGGEKKKFYQKKWFWVVVGIFLLGNIFCGDNTEELLESKSNLYDNAQIKDVFNGSRTEKIGEYSIIEMNSKEVSDELLTEWYFNYILKNDFKYCLILYTDKDNKIGIHGVGNAYINKNVQIEKDEYGDYVVNNSSNSITYFPTKNGKLEKWNK